MTLPTGRHSSSRKAFRYHRTLRLRSFWDFFSATLRKRVVGRPASFGALSALRDYFAVLLASSEATLAYFDLGCLDCVEGSQITVPVTVLSEVRFAPVRIEFDQPIIESSATNQKQALAIMSPVQMRSLHSTLVQLEARALSHGMLRIPPAPRPR